MHLSAPWRSAIAMLAGVAFFSFMDATLKTLSAFYPAMQVAALRGLAALPMVVVYTAWRVPVAQLFQVQWRLHFLRCVLNVATLWLFTYGIAHLALAQAYTIFFISPLLVTALAVPLLKEHASPAHWVAIGLGLLGVLIAMRPGSNVDSLWQSWGALAILGSAICYGLTVITARLLGRSESNASIVFWTIALMSLGASLLAIGDWQPLQTEHFLLIVILGVTGFLGTVAMTYAFAHGKTANVAPLEYTALVWAVAIDWVVWGAAPDRWTLIGGLVVILSGVYLIRFARHDGASKTDTELSPIDQSLH
jgi:drug/metabolite transporter (DMT)-like permease